MCIQNPGCGEPTGALSVTLPTDLTTRMQAVADARGCTVDELVEEAFSTAGGRVCPVLETD
ncbi:hypothetical protein [Streptomyces mangrovi]|uniref:hypothetical protein n=1 Tax=Streptomyces mangrovi TaxID=1206892 RepID=UPI00399CC78E